MIGTIICRNCDTAIEVSERDVSTFESQASFGCPSCKEDLSARMADLLGTNRPAPSEERTVEEETADADAFEGLPVGGSLDEAARAMRGPTSPAAAPTVPSSGAMGASSSAGVVPDVGGEDPLTLALRIAHQAQEAAAAAEAANGNGAHEAPHANGNGATNGAGAAGSEVGVIPDEPDNEDTVRARANATQSTVDSAPGSEGTIPEPTIPSESDLIAPDTSDSGPVIGEETPALTEEQRASLLAEENEPDTIIDEPPATRGAVPDAPSAEATPSAPRPSPLAQMPEEPREEPTIRKTSPPPTLTAPARLAPRTGTGPSGIGALGFRISSNRPVVRPAFNGRPSSPSLAPAGATPVAGSTAIERPSERVSIERPLADRPSRANIPVSRAAAPPPSPVPMTVPVSVALEPPPSVTGRGGSGNQRPAVPVWLLGIGVGLIASIIVAGLAWIFLGGTPSETPVATPTPVGEATDAIPMETPEVALPTATATLASATRTATPIATVTPKPTSTRSAPTATATAVAAASVKPATPTPAPTAAAAKSGKDRVEDLARGKDTKQAASAVFLAARTSTDADFVYAAWKFLADQSSRTKKDDQAFANRYAKELALIALRLPGLKPYEASLVRGWVERYDAEPH